MSPQTRPDNLTPSTATTTANLHRLTLPGPMLQRGFWLYIWRVQTPTGERLYVGRTGDNSSPNATAPYTRMGQHLGFLKNQNSLRRLLIQAGVEPESCDMFDLIAYGPIFPEIGKRNGLNRDELMLLHIPVRDQIAGLEKKLRDALVAAGHNVLNVVRSNKPYETAQWNSVRLAFAEHFPELRRIDQ